jgi:alpha-galactosidase
MMVTTAFLLTGGEEMTSRITLVLDAAERQALEELAERELRDVRQQAILIIRRELQRLGLLSVEGETADA